MMRTQYSGLPNVDEGESLIGGGSSSLLLDQVLGADVISGHRAGVQSVSDPKTA